MMSYAEALSLKAWYDNQGTGGYENYDWMPYPPDLKFAIERYGLKTKTEIPINKKTVADSKLPY